MFPELMISSLLVFIIAFFVSFVVASIIIDNILLKFQQKKGGNYLSIRSIYKKIKSGDFKFHGVKTLEVDLCDTLLEEMNDLVIEIDNKIYLISYLSGMKYGHTLFVVNDESGVFENHIKEDELSFDWFSLAWGSWNLHCVYTRGTHNKFNMCGILPVEWYYKKLDSMFKDMFILEEL